jgi:hypothetical protein
MVGFKGSTQDKRASEIFRFGYAPFTEYLSRF